MKPTPEKPRAAARRPRAIVVTGGIGSGKSAFCASLAAKPGVRCLSADAIARGLLAEDAGVRAEVLAAFGPEILDGSGGIDRARLAALVFPEPERLRRLEAILHPRVRARLAAEVGRLKADPSTAMVLVEIPLLLETGVPEWCDRVVTMEASRGARLARLARRGMPPGEAERRMARQGEDEARRAIADDRLVNDGDLASWARLAETWWRSQVSEQE